MPTWGVSVTVTRMLTLDIISDPAAQPITSHFSPVLQEMFQLVAAVQDSAAWRRNAVLRRRSGVAAQVLLLHLVKVRDGRALRCCGGDSRSADVYLAQGARAVLHALSCILLGA